MIFQTSAVRPPRVPVKVCGGFFNYCDPRGFKDVWIPKEEGWRSRPWRVAVGIHQKHAARVADVDIYELTRFLCDPRVSAVSEVGLDHSAPPREWSSQVLLLREILTLPIKEKVLVLHLRGEDTDPTAHVPHQRCLEQVFTRRCAPAQRIHWHCCTAGSAQVGAWMREHPQTHFGFTSTVFGFSGDQQEAVRRVPKNRLLLESDAPHLSPAGLRTNTPAYLGEVALVVAKIRREPLAEVVAHANANARRLYDF